MQIKTATFLRAVTSEENLVQDNLPQVAFIGRSNVGKSSIINTITGIKALARSSSTPGATKEINFFLINNTFYFVDLPGYGFAQGSHQHRTIIADRIAWYLGHEPIATQKIILIIDAKIGATNDDKEVLNMLVSNHKDFVVVLNKVDKLKKMELQKCFQEIQILVKTHPIILFSSKSKIGIKEIVAIIIPKK